MALAFYGAEHDEAELRRLFRTRGMGTSPARVMIALPQLGFQAIVFDGAVGLLVDNLADGLPCIAHLWTEHLSYWQDRDPVIHAVVVLALTKDQVLINDPAFDHGSQSIPFQEFLNAWRSAGYLLMVIRPEEE
jgi:ABC-type bacteriocin/lantibiotic exporter with double-glycine peptidase domain